MNYACVYVNGFSLPPVSPLVDMAVNKCAATKIHVNQCNLWTWFTFLQNNKQDISFVLTWYIGPLRERERDALGCCFFQNMDKFEQHKKCTNVNSIIHSCTGQLNSTKLNTL